MRILLVLLQFSAFSFYASSLNVDIRAKAAMLINADTGAILFEKNGDLVSYPASITKIGTALFILDSKNPNLQGSVIVSPEAIKSNPLKLRSESTPAHWHETDSSTMKLAKGEKLTVEDLLHGLILISANDGANALAEALGGSVIQFTTELNQYLASIGCTKTHFMNPHGYHHPKHVSTPRDLCLIMRKALKIPAFKELLKKKQYTYSKSNKKSVTLIESTNALIFQNSQHYYPNAIGGKTGFHTPAGYCLISAAEHDGRTLIACVLGCANKADRYLDTKKLYEKAFREKKVKQTVVSMDMVFQRKVNELKKPIVARLTRDVTIGYFPSETPTVRAFLYWDELTYPVRPGVKVGDLKVFDQIGNLLADEPVLCSEFVEETWLHFINRNFLNFFKRSVS
jgi:D-alanyl-D-alanine carboxypeptidase (penicillin-binding protein 5/6)